MHTLGYLYCSVECTLSWSWKPSVAAIAIEKNTQLEISTTNYAEPNCTLTFLSSMVVSLSSSTTRDTSFRERASWDPVLTACLICPSVGCAPIWCGGRFREVHDPSSD